jgi:hypothetical protein
MPSLPQFQSNDRVFQMLQNVWATLLNPLLKNPALNSTTLKEVNLVTGSNAINHKLGRKLQGWSLVRQRGVAASIYDEQDSNQMPDLTLVLVSSADVTVDILVF